MKSRLLLAISLMLATDTMECESPAYLIYNYKYTNTRPVSFSTNVSCILAMYRALFSRGYIDLFQLLSARSELQCLFFSVFPRGIATNFVHAAFTQTVWFIIMFLLKKGVKIYTRYNQLPASSGRHVCAIFTMCVSHKFVFIHFD